MRTRPALLALLAALVPLSAQGRTFISETTYRLGYAHVEIQGEGHAGPYALPHTHLFAGSETLRLQGVSLTQGKEYWIRSDRGEVTFVSILEEGESVEARYRYFPLPLPVEKVLHKLRLAGEEETVLPGRRVREQMSGPLDTGALRVGGSKSFALLIGSGRELSLEQALRVNITGNITPDVRVTARLTDQNLPFQPDGRSERLEELDEVLIRIESPRVEATLGDYEVHYHDTEFAGYDRVLKGAMGVVKSDRFGAELSGGVSRGEFRSVEIRGVEGKQGPYSLLEASALGEIVVAGSEEVWLNGERLTRGDENDYVIDYSGGTITFNPGRGISSESRIAADFQVSGDRYRRVFFTGRAHARSRDGRFLLRGAILSEKDDEDEPEAIILGEAELDSLRASGDREPLGSSARYVGEGGDYDTLGGHFVFAGIDSGAFLVPFSRVEEGEGAYTDSVSELWGRRIYVHVGEGNGNYTPHVSMPLPASHTLFSLSGEARPLTQLVLNGEIAWTELDRNILSPVDDGDNAGTGARFSALLQPVPLRAAGTVLCDLSLRANFREVTANFEPLGRYRDPHADDRWMTADLRRAVGPGRQENDLLGGGDAFRARGSERVLDGGGRIERTGALGRFSLSGEGGRMTRDDFRSGRWTWKTALSGDGRYGASYTEEHIESDQGDTLSGESRHRTAEGSVRVSAFRPSVRYRSGRRTFTEWERESDGTRSRERRFGLGVGEGRDFSGDLYVTYEERDYIDSVSARWESWYDARTDEASVQWDGSVSVDASYAHRTLDYGGTVDEGNRESNRGRMEVSHRGWGGALRINGNYQVTSEEERSRYKVLLQAPTGEEADYDSLGNYFPDEGTYNLVILEGEDKPVTDLEIGATVRIDGGRREEWKENRLLNGLRSETFVRVQERSATDDPVSLLLLQPAAFQRDDVTVRGSTTFRQEFRWTDPESEGSLRLRVQREDREANEYETIHRDDLVHTFLAGGKIPLSDVFTGEIEWNRRLEREDSNGERAVDLASDDWKAALIFQPTPRWRVRLPGAFRNERESVKEESVASVRLEPEASIHIAANGRVDVRMSYTHFVREEMNRSGSFLRDRKEGLRWRTQFAYEWNRVLNSSVSYNGESLKGDDVEHRFRAEMRAYF